MKKFNLKTWLLVIALFAGFTFAGCEKDDGKDNSKVTNNGTSSGIEALSFCMLDPNSNELQEKYVVKSKDAFLITYEYADERQDEIACLYYYDIVQKMGCYFVFEGNSATQFLISEQGERLKDAYQITFYESLVGIKQLECDWTTNEFSLVDELFFKQEDGNEVAPLMAKANRYDERSVALTHGLMDRFFDNAGKVFTEGAKALKAFNIPFAGDAMDSAPDMLEKAKKTVKEEAWYTMPFADIKEEITKKIEDVKCNFVVERNSLFIDIEDYVENKLANKLKEHGKVYADAFRAIFPPKPEPPYLQLSAEEINFDYSSGTGSFLIDTNMEIAVSSTADWCKISSSTSKEVKFTVEVNHISEPRFAAIQIIAVHPATNNTVTKTVAVNQKAALADYLKLPEAMTALVSGGTDFFVPVETNLQVTAASSTSDWCKVTSFANDMVGYDAEENTTAEPRTATITVTAVNLATNNTITKSVVINQAAAAPYLTIPQEPINYSALAATGSFPIDTNMQITASAAPAWCKVTSYTNTEVRFSVEENKTGAPRSAIIHVTAVDNTMRKSIVVNQEAAIPADYLTFSQQPLYPAAGGLTLPPILINTNMEITVSSTADWCKINSYTNTEARFTIEANQTSETRSANIVVTAVNPVTHNTITKTIAVHQEAGTGTPPALDLANTSWALGNGTITFRSDGTCSMPDGGGDVLTGRWSLTGNNVTFNLGFSEITEGCRWSVDLKFKATVTGNTMTGSVDATWSDCEFGTEHIPGEPFTATKK